MPFPMRIQPVDAEWTAPGGPKGLAVATKPPAPKSRLKRLFERQFPGVLRTSSAERIVAAAAGDGKERERERDGGGGDLEPSSVCLAKMVQNFLEESNEKPSRCGRSRCNCFNGGCDGSSDDDLDLFFAHDAPSSAPPSSAEASDILKSLVLCGSTVERNILADTSRIVEKNRVKGGGGSKDDEDRCRRAVADELVALGYDASTCKSRWEKSPSFPAGEYEYIDVIVDGSERVLVDIDFRSEFEIARPNKAYRAVLQFLPAIFVGKPERLQQVVALVSEAARQSMKKKGLHVPPWRKCEYMKSKWFSPYKRMVSSTTAEDVGEGERIDSGEEEKPAAQLDLGLEKSGEFTEAKVEQPPAVEKWEPPPVLPKRGARVVTGLASLV